MTEADAREYVTLLDQTEDGQMVQVDDSELETYEKSYARGERVRTAIKKFELTDKKIQVIAFPTEHDDESGEPTKFVSAVTYKA
jgi:hypothetical protein